jgi:hypothetical protein
MAADDLLELLRTRLPLLFARAIARLEQSASRGDENARTRLSELDAGPAAALVRLEGAGGGELRLASTGRTLTVGAGPGAPAFGHAIALSVAAARTGLGSLGEGDREAEQFARAWAAVVSATARELFATTSYGFDLEILRIPGLGDLRTRIQLGRAELPAQPEFKLSLDYDELEDAREQGLGPHQLFFAGKVRIDGDVAKAMMLGMTLAQLRS